jgi:hypothetical protein
MKLFLKNVLKFSLIGLIPLLILTLGYLYYDPFKVVKSYNDYSHSAVVLNRDFTSTEMFLKNQAKEKYNSFVFGSSRTLAFRPHPWAKYLPNQAKPFIFEAAGESIYGIYTKLKYLDAKKVQIDNALLIICRDHSFANDANHSGHLYIKHPITSGESNFDFHWLFYKAYLNPRFLFCFHIFTFTNNYKPYMDGCIDYKNKKVRINSQTNEATNVYYEDELAKNEDTYYAKRETMFYKRSGEKIDSVDRINKKHLFMLGEIKKILAKNKTNYKVVLTPLYEQVKFSKNDFKILKATFGTNLYDFTGKNKFTENKRNYYETSHFRPNVGDSIFKIIYRK